MDHIVTDWFTLMIAVLGGFGITHILVLVNWPEQPVERFWFALMLALYCSLLYLGVTQSEPKFYAVAVFAFTGVTFRSFVELCLRHWEISQAIEAINALSTVEERRAYYARLSQDIQAAVDKRTPRPDLWKAPAQPTLLGNCTNPGRVA